MLIKASARQGLGLLRYGLYGSPLLDGIDQIFLQIKGNLLIRFQKGGDDRMHVPAIRTAEAENADLNAMGKREYCAFIMTMPMRRMLTLTAFRTLLGAIFLRQTVRPNDLHIVRYVLMPQGRDGC